MFKERDATVSKIGGGDMWKNISSSIKKDSVGEKKEEKEEKKDGNDGRGKPDPNR